MCKNDLLQSLRRPKGVFLAFTYVLCVIFCIGSIALAVMEKGPILEVVAYVVYGCAGISLSYAVFTIVVYAPIIKCKLISKMRESEFLSCILDSYGYRTVVFASISFVINILYVAFNVVLSVFLHSGWYFNLACYYLVLTLVRGSIVLFHRKRKKGVEITAENVKEVERKKYRFCGVMLILLSLFLSFSVLQIVRDDLAFVHLGWTVYAVAAYAFFKITLSIINLVKSRKTDDLTVQALRKVGFADSMVSILALQTTLLYAFSEGGNGVVNAVTGFVVCALTITMGVTMIINSKKKKG